MDFELWKINLLNLLNKTTFFQKKRRALKFSSFIFSRFFSPNSVFFLIFMNYGKIPIDPIFHWKFAESGQNTDERSSYIGPIVLLAGGAHNMDLWNLSYENFWEISNRYEHWKNVAWQCQIDRLSEKQWEINHFEFKHFRNLQIQNDLLPIVYLFFRT